MSAPSLSNQKSFPASKTGLFSNMKCRACWKEKAKIENVWLTRLF